MTFHEFQCVESAVKAYRHDLTRLRNVRKALSSDKLDDVDVTLDGKSLLVGFVDEAHDVDAHYELSLAILRAVEKYLAHTLNQTAEELQSLNFEIDLDEPDIRGGPD